MAHTVIGVFDNATEAQQAVDELVSEGFSRSNIDLSAQTGSNSSDVNSTMNTTNDGSIVPDRHKNTSGTYTEEVVDDTKDVGSSIGNFFSSLFGGDDADRYARVADSGTIVTVHAQSDDEAERAADILDDNGAVDVDERAAQYGYGSTTTGTTTGAATGMMGTGYTDTTNRDLTTDADQKIQVIQENLEIGKREVERGGVRVRSRIVEKPIEESLRLREERVSVQRTPVNRPASDADLNAFQEGEISLTEHAEVPVVSKTANVVEEISIGKEVNERVETIRDTVRNTEVDVENITPMTTTDTTTDRSTTNTGMDRDDDTTTYSTNR